METKSVRLPMPVYRKAKEIKKQHNYPTLGEAIRHAMREADYDV